MYLLKQKQYNECSASVYIENIIGIVVDFAFGMKGFASSSEW